MEHITGRGKTTKLIEMAHDTNKLIVCHSHEEAKIIHETALRTDKKIHMPITYNEMLEGRYYSPHTESLLIDNVMYFIEMVGHGKVEAVTYDV